MSYVSNITDMQGAGSVVNDGTGRRASVANPTSVVLPLGKAFRRNAFCRRIGCINKPEPPALNISYSSITGKTSRD